ncbi:MAG: amino acid ABC transporter substrate-binding protein [Flavihumibacter sp.]|nr:amino acid ABC transporter substrate-binding protein [Flavihumibacter sp.]
MKLTKLALLLILLVAARNTLAQTDSIPPRQKVAVFAPLFLDSAFTESGDYKQGKQFPKYSIAGLEFYEGIQLAIDSLNKEKVPLEVFVYDTRSTKQSIAAQIAATTQNNIGLIIGHVTQPEAKLLAEAALKRNIPFVNASLPNDAGITANPSYIILNATLKTHCEGIYKMLQKNYSTSPVLVVTKKGMMEDRLKQYFTAYEKSTNSSKLNFKYVYIDEANPITNLQKQLDSNRLSVLIAGSMDENFGRLVAQQASLLKPVYENVLVGMPTWETFTDLNKKEYKGLELIYSTPFYNAKTDKASNSINNYFKTYMYSRPSDMVFRGYECLYRFGKLLAEKGSNLQNSIGEKKYRVFTDFDIQPVLNSQTLALDYFENKKLYFIKKIDGVVKTVL